jgi:DNA-binding phage protein
MASPLLKINEKLPPILKEVFREAHRQELAMSELARMAGYDRKTVYSIKDGEHSPRIETIMDIGQALGLELHWKEIPHGNVRKAR